MRERRSAAKEKEGSLAFLSYLLFSQDSRFVCRLLIRDEKGEKKEMREKKQKE